VLMIEKFLDQLRTDLGTRGCDFVMTSVVRDPVVGRCRLPVPKPELKARLVSAFETKM